MACRTEETALLGTCTTSLLELLQGPRHSLHLTGGREGLAAKPDGHKQPSTPQLQVRSGTV